MVKLTSGSTLFAGLFLPTTVVTGFVYQSVSLKPLSIRPSQSVRVSPILR